MSLARLLPQLQGLRIDVVTPTAERVVIVASPRRRTAACPLCGHRSSQVHSRYHRTLADVPLGGQPVLLQIRVRRFRCLRRRCPRRIFAERLPRLTTVRGRRTHGQCAALTAVGFALGGAPGARLGHRLGLPTSRSTLLRLIRAAPVRDLPPPRVLGVDDWATRKGQRYGTILVDLEQHRPVDLLADRTAATFANWLSAHTGPDVISRDRGGAYAEGARQGAPGAVQVADRFHLLSNAGDALERVLNRHHAALREAATAVNAQRLPPTSPAPAAAPTAAPQAATAHPTRMQQEQATRRARRLARYEQVVAQHHAGQSQVAIGAQVGISRKTVRRYLRADCFPERARPRRGPGLLTPHEPYLRERWMEGCHNAHTLWEELQRRGFAGAPALVRRHVAAWRTTPARRGRAAQQAERGVRGVAPAPPLTRPWSPRQARWMLTKTTADREPDAQAYCTALLEHAPEVAAVAEHITAFGRLVRERDRAALGDWLREAEQGGIAEVRGFAAGIRRNQAAVEAALEWEWSNGQTEGQINRLKVLKRQMYGRAKLDLLRQRFLSAA